MLADNVPGRCSNLLDIKTSAPAGLDNMHWLGTWITELERRASLDEADLQQQPTWIFAIACGSHTAIGSCHQQLWLAY